MKVRSLHRWNVGTARARAIQEELRARLELRGGPEEIRTVAGADASYSKDSDLFHAVVVVLSFPALELVEEASASGRVSFPYVPGLLSFREAPILLRAIRKLKTTPDVLVCDGQGFAHPRRLGLASHVGLLVDVPAVGCAKKRLIGAHGPVRDRRGEHVLLVDGDELIGAVVRTRRGVKPVFVSVGHRIGLDRAIEIVLACTRGYRIPEPTRIAHRRVNELRRRIEGIGPASSKP